MKIRIEYKRFWFFKRVLVLDVPQRWNDLPQQLVVNHPYLLMTLYVSENKDIQDKDIYELMPDLMGISKRMFVRIPPEVIKAKNSKGQTLLSLTDFLKRKEMVYSWWIKDFKLKQKMTPPSDRFDNFTFNQFIHTDTYFLIYTQKNENEYLNKFIASLFFVGDAFEEKNIETIAKQVEKQNHLFKIACYFNYMVLRNWLANQKEYRQIFIRYDEHVKNKQVNNKPVPIDTWLTIAEKLRPRWDNGEKILAMPLVAVLRDLNAEIEDSRKKK